MPALKERNKDLQPAHSFQPFIRSCINPNFVLVGAMRLLARLVALHLVLAVPVRIGFMPFQSFTYEVGNPALVRTRVLMWAIDG